MAAQIRVPRATPWAVEGRRFKASVGKLARGIWGSLAVWLLLLASAGAQTAQPATPQPNEKALREKWQQVYQKIAGSIEMRRGETPLQLEGAPLLFYTNPERL